MATQNFLDEKLVKAAKFFLNQSVSGITDYKQLNERLGKIGNYSGSLKNKMIVARMIELNAICVDYWRLSKYLSNDISPSFASSIPYLDAASFNPLIQKSIRDRMIKLNKNCVEYDELLIRKENTSDYNLDKIIEDRMTELNDNCTDYYELSRRWGKDFLRKEIEKRMIELNKIQLPKITDCDELIRRSWCLDFKIVIVENQFKTRFIELMKKKTFLIKLLRKGEDNLPDFLEEIVISLAQKILQQQ